VDVSLVLMSTSQKFSVTCPSAFFVESTPVPPEHKKRSADVSRPRRIRMHYVTHRFQWKQKHKFGVTCPSAIFMETAPGPDHEKECIDVLRPERTGMHFVTRRSHRMLKHKFSVTCPDALFVESMQSHPSIKK
jgi:hypothetical protein